MKLRHILESGERRAEQTKDMLKAYADSVAKTDFELMAPALEKYFPEARFEGMMYRAVDFDIDDSFFKFFGTARGISDCDSINLIRSLAGSLSNPLGLMLFFMFT